MKFVFAILCTGLSFLCSAQFKAPAIDKSPLDVSYYPVNYPVIKIQDKANEPLVARVIYSRPQKNGRSVFGELIEYGKVWRMGANEATEIEFFVPVSINNVKIKKGRYTLYTIPDKDKWTMILNKDVDTWGSFKYDVKKDVVRLDVPAQKLDETAEFMFMVFDKVDAKNFNLVTGWDDVKIVLPITL